MWDVCPSHSLLSGPFWYMGRRVHYCWVCKARWEGGGREITAALTDWRLLVEMLSLCTCSHNCYKHLSDKPILNEFNLISFDFISLENQTCKYITVSQQINNLYNLYLYINIFKNKGMMHKYLCHNSEALKTNCKKNQLISIVDLDFWHPKHILAA